MTDVAVYDALRPLENNHEHYRREVEQLTIALASEHTRHEREIERIKEQITEAIRARETCRVALQAARKAVAEMSGGAP